MKRVFLLLLYIYLSSLQSFIMLSHIVVIFHQRYPVLIAEASDAFD